MFRFALADNWLLIVTAIFEVAVIWYMVCNFQTFRDRGLVLERVSALAKSRIGLHDDSFLEPYRLFEQVGYQRHLFARFLFRDPWKLYPPGLHLVGIPFSNRKTIKILPRGK